jgi:hypothetical protein
MFSGPGKAACQEPEMGDEKPSRFGCRGSLKVSCEAATPTEPGESPFDDPAPRQELEAFDPRRTLDDLDVPRPAMGECIDELFAAIHSISNHILEPGKTLSQALQQWDGTMNILDVGRMNMES